MKKAILATAALMLAGSAFGQTFVYPDAWSASKPSEVKEGGVYRTSTISDYKTLNPFTAAESGNIPQVLTAADGMFKYDAATGEYIPYMASSYTVSKDKLVWTMNIRKGMKWSDGKPIVADDFITTFKIHTDEDVGSNSYDGFFINDKPIKIKKVDADTIQAILPSVSADAIETLAYSPFPDHIFGPVYASKGAAGIKAMWTLNTPADQVVSAGAFKFKSYKPGERLELVANSSYGEWNKNSAGNGLPYLSGRTVAIVKDVTAQLAAYLNGDIDAFNPANADQLRQVKGAIDASKLKAVLRANVGPAASSQWIVFNWNQKSNPSKQTMFRDDNFRRAMSHLTNRAAMVDLVYGGLAQPAYSSVYAAFTQWISPDLKKFDYNVEAATALLAKAGFTKKNSDGYLVNKAGKVAEFDLTTNSGNNQREQLAKIFADEAKKAGVKVNFKPVDFNTLVQLLLSEGDDRKFDAILLGLSGGGRIYPLGDNVEPCGTNLHAFNKSGKCLAAWETQVTALFARGKQELDFKKRVAIAQQIQNVQSGYQAWDYLVSPNAHFSWASSVKGEYPTPLQTSINTAREGVAETTWLQK
jgi:peptide/nickel transport system substrate-binding protein